MRIVNSMIFGNSMNNIWRNKNHINNMAQQIETSKVIQRPSDNPHISSRALRYRTMLAENQRFLMNVDSGLSWMEVTEGSFLNILYGSESIIGRMYDQFVRAAHGTYELEDRRAIMEYLTELKNQLRLEMNQTYMGRYVFSGFHTGQPPILEHPLNATFRITQDFQASDVKQFNTSQRPMLTDLPHVTERVRILHLPFRNIDVVDDGPPIQHAIEVPGFTVVSRTLLDVPAGAVEGFTPPGGDPAYEPPNATTVHFIPETGELVFHRDAVIPANFQVIYTQTNFDRGEPNPMIYFQSTRIDAAATAPGATMATPPDPAALPDPYPGTFTFERTVRSATQVFPPGTPVPGNVELLTEYHAAEQNIRLEFSTSTHLDINSHASNVFSANLYSDLLRLIEFIGSLNPTDPGMIRAHYEARALEEGRQIDIDNAVAEFQQAEAQAHADLLHRRFSDMLLAHETHLSNIQREHSHLGARMERLDMMAIRLEEDEIYTTALLSATEDADVPGIIMRMNSAQATFRDAMQSIAMLTGLSLADFINR